MGVQPVDERPPTTGATAGIVLTMLAALTVSGVRAVNAAPPGPGRRLPTPPPGWTLEVVAEAPALRHPAAVCSAPDGRVFVAEDPMDISAPAAELPHGRIRCLHPDGRITTFADVPSTRAA